MEGANKAAEKKASDASTIAQLRAEVAKLTQQVSSLQEGQALAIAAAELKIEKDHAFKLLARYQDGLRHGALLAQGGQMASSSPDFTGTPL